MQLAGKQAIAADPQTVWNLLTDPGVVAGCVPGLKEFEVVDPMSEFKAEATLGLGGVKATFSADIIWEELDEPRYARMRAEGSAPGNRVTATSEMHLSEDGAAGTLLEWTADVNISGTLASVAGRMMDSVAKRMSAEFFACVKERIEAE